MPRLLRRHAAQPLPASTLSFCASPRAAKPNKPAYPFGKYDIESDRYDHRQAGLRRSPHFGTAVSLLNGNLGKASLNITAMLAWS
jgi:hypothetical protein